PVAARAPVGDAGADAGVAAAGEDDLGPEALQDLLQPVGDVPVVRVLGVPGGRRGPRGVALLVPVADVDLLGDGGGMGVVAAVVAGVDHNDLAGQCGLLRRAHQGRG